MKKEQIINRLDPRFFSGICHRGYHNRKDIENGPRAFQNAIDNDMAFELDVHLTTDNRLIVVHDSELERVTGKKGIVEEMSVKEIQENYPLLDKETIPTLQEVLDMNQEKVPMVIELKVYRKNYKPLAKRLLEELSGVKDRSRFMLISFDPRALLPFEDSGFIRQLLVAHDGKHEYVYAFRHLFEGVDLDWKFLLEDKYRKYAKKHVVNVWTIESEEQMKEVLPYCDTITFQYLEASLVRSSLEDGRKPFKKA